ncbi:DNA/RNA non-specific endonuclease [Lentzea sp. NPDC055074]
MLHHQAVAPTRSPLAHAPAHALQRAVGNRAVTGLVQRLAVQRASRSDLLTALRGAIQAGEWQTVATRLNGFNDADIVRLSAGLSVGEAANTRAAVAVHLAGWPQEQTIIAALDRGRAEVARIGRIYQAYEQGVRAGEWDAVTRQLHVMSDQDIAARLAKLPPDAIRGLAEVAHDHSERIAGKVAKTAKDRGVDVPDRSAHLVVGDRDLGPVAEQQQTGGERIVAVDSELARGEGASIGGRPLASGPVVVLSALPAVDLAKTAREASGIYRIVAGRLVPITTQTVARRGAFGLAVKAPVFVVLTLVGVAVTLGVAYAIAHTQEINAQMDKWGGTLPPGGLADTDPAQEEKPDGGDGDCECLPGTHATYGGLDSLGRATGVRATMRGRTWSGQRPLEDPAGYSGVVAGQHRAHLLARVLGGSGGMENLVPFGGLQNIRMYVDVESYVEEFVTLNPSTCVEYTATPVYEGRVLSPVAIEVVARDLCTGKEIIRRTVANYTIH